MNRQADTHDENIIFPQFRWPGNYGHSSGILIFPAYLRMVLISSMTRDKEALPAGKVRY